jgi:hypothetical protein
MELKSSSPVPWQKIREKTSENGCYSLIIHAYFLVVNYWHVLRIGPTQVLRMDNLPFQAKVLYGDCMSLVKKTNVNSKNKQDPNPKRYILYKDLIVFIFRVIMLIISLWIVFHNLQKREVVVSDSPVPVAKIDTACK